MNPETTHSPAQTSPSDSTLRELADAMLDLARNRSTSPDEELLALLELHAKDPRDEIARVIQVVTATLRALAPQEQRPRLGRILGHVASASLTPRDGLRDLAGLASSLFNSGEQIADVVRRLAVAVELLVGGALPVHKSELTEVLAGVAELDPIALARAEATISLKSTHGAETCRVGELLRDPKGAIHPQWVAASESSQVALEIRDRLADRATPGPKPWRRPVPIAWIAAGIGCVVLTALMVTSGSTPPPVAIPQTETVEVPEPVTRELPPNEPIPDFVLDSISGKNVVVAGAVPREFLTRLQQLIHSWGAARETESAPAALPRWEPFAETELASHIEVEALHQPAVRRLLPLLRRAGFFRGTHFMLVEFLEGTAERFSAQVSLLSLGSEDGPVAGDGERSWTGVIHLNLMAPSHGFLHSRRAPQTLTSLAELDPMKRFAIAQLLLADRENSTGRIKLATALLLLEDQSLGADGAEAVAKERTNRRRIARTALREAGRHHPRDSEEFRSLLNLLLAATDDAAAKVALQTEYATELGEGYSQMDPAELQNWLSQILHNASLHRG